MKNHWLVCISLTTILGTALGCGGDGSGGGTSGLNGSETIVSLDASERDQFCEWVVETAGPERTVECGGGVTVTTGGGTKAECLTDFPTTETHPNCTVTVAQAEACLEALTALDPCSESFPPECAPLAAEGCATTDADI